MPQIYGSRLARMWKVDQNDDFLTKVQYHLILILLINASIIEEPGLGKYSESPYTSLPSSPLHAHVFTMSLKQTTPRRAPQLAPQSHEASTCPNISSSISGHTLVLSMYLMKTVYVWTFWQDFVSWIVHTLVFRLHPFQDLHAPI